MKKILALVFAVALNGCSVYKAVTQPPDVDLVGIGVGTPRVDVIARLGPPLFEDIDKKGQTKDVFEFQSGFEQTSKLRVIPYILADVLTLTVAELVLWPMEMTILEQATCTAVAAYDDKSRVKDWQVRRKKAISIQRC